ncbi:MAG: transglycosylase SLT domain-containing protein, partial [Nitrospinota bacterium]
MRGGRWLAAAGVLFFLIGGCANYNYRVADRVVPQPLAPEARAPQPPLHEELRTTLAPPVEPPPEFLPPLSLPRPERPIAPAEEKPPAPSAAPERPAPLPEGGPRVPPVLERAKPERPPLPAAKPAEPPFDMPVVMNRWVRQQLAHYQGPGRKQFAFWLGRMGRYAELIRSILKEEGLPQDLLYLALIESGFNPRAYSRAGASGLWQFIRGTARKYGLRVDFWVDERRDPVKATRAAARYLKSLHAILGSWELALAAYNAGELRVLAGIRRAGTRDLWRLVRTRHLPWETRKFVPKFMAAMLIAKDRARYGFGDVKPETPLRFETVPLPRPARLSAVARAAGVPLQVVLDLNPALRRSVTPPGRNYSIRVPEGRGSELLARLPGTGRTVYLIGRRHTIQPGDTFSDLAALYGVSLAALLELNSSLHPRRLLPGTVVIIPSRARSTETVEAQGPATASDVRRTSTPPLV